MSNGNTLNLYLISQTVNNGYDTFDSAVVAARYEDAIARTMARSEYPLAGFEGSPRVLFEKIKQLREGDGNE